MSIKNLTMLALKILALYFIATGIMAMPVIMTNPNLISQNIFEILKPFIGFGLPSLTIGLIIWCASQKLTSMILPGMEQETAKTAPQLQEFYQLAFVVVGLYLFSQALPECIHVILTQLNVPGHYIYNNGSAGYFALRLLIPLLKLLMGMWFLFRNRHLASSLLREIEK